MKSFLDKKELTDVLAQLKAALEKMDEDRRKIEKLESELVVTKNVSTILKKEIATIKKEFDETNDALYDLEKERLRDNQYGRRENVEIANIPENVKDEQLESTVIKIMDEIGVAVESNDISACHRLKNGSTIVRFLNRKNAIKLFEKNIVIKSFDFEGLFGKKTKLFINPNLCPQLKRLFWTLRQLKNAKLVAYYGSDQNGIYHQKEKKARKQYIYLEQDLYSFVPENK